MSLKDLEQADRSARIAVLSAIHSSSLIFTRSRMEVRKRRLKRIAIMGFLLVAAAVVITNFLPPAPYPKGIPGEPSRASAANQQPQLNPVPSLAEIVTPAERLPADSPELSIRLSYELSQSQ